MTRHPVAAAALAITLAQISVNVGAALGKGLFPLVGPEGVAMLRTVLSAAILLAIARPWRALPTPRQSVWLALYGLAIGAMNLLIYAAIARIPLGLAVAIELAGPLAVVLLTSRSLRDLLWFALAVASLAMLVPWPGSGDRLDPAGIALALGAGACWALYILLGKRAAEVDGRTAVALGMCAACLLTVPLGTAAAGTSVLAPAVLALGLVVALLSSAIPYLLEMVALGRVSSRLFGVITSSAPAIGAMCGFFILGERLTPLQWLAVAAMIAASAGCTLTSRPPGAGRAEEQMR